MATIASQLRPEWEKLSQEEFRREIRDLSSVADLAIFWNIPEFQLNYHAFHAEKAQSYSTFMIPRRNGRRRRIEEPSLTLKYIQRILHE